MDPVDAPQTTRSPGRGPVGQECWLSKCVGLLRCYDHTPECTVFETDRLNYHPSGKRLGRRRGVCGAIELVDVRPAFDPRGRAR